MRVRPAVPRDLEAIHAVLHEHGLSTSDVTVETLNGFLVAVDHKRIVGCVGVDRYGSVGLLRSLAVRLLERNDGLGHRLLVSVEKRCLADEISELWLLTTDAPNFFIGAGYRLSARNTAPDDLRATAQFASICPASAVCLRKQLC
ncbi:arsenic resistance N-acetyltransferase ArsN2 [Caballeronia sp. S22]|uniref:arsenic resistance N-acetyltransferase ArsN2 n=1 Tax=Caballeronia sp. S22 TaxID=3137182 RepID=UPI0035310FE0